MSNQCIKFYITSLYSSRKISNILYGDTFLARPVYMCTLQPKKLIVWHVFKPHRQAHRLRRRCFYRDIAYSRLQAIFVLSLAASQGSVSVHSPAVIKQLATNHTTIWLTPTFPLRGPHNSEPETRVCDLR